MKHRVGTDIFTKQKFHYSAQIAQHPCVDSPACFQFTKIENCSLTVEEADVIDTAREIGNEVGKRKNISVIITIYPS